MCFCGVLVPLLLLAIIGSTTAVPGLLIPLYAYPTENGGALWETVRKTAIANPKVPFVVIVNPNSGPGTSEDSVFTSAIDGLVNAKIKCIGYVPTNYSNTPLSAVTGNMDRYKSWYPQLTGFFLDEMAYDGNHESYYANLTSYAISLGKPYTVGNPGTSTTNDYFQTVNNTVIYETNYLPKPEALNFGFPVSGCSMIAYNVPGSELNQSYINDITKYVSLLYITDDVLDNPYDTLPSYLSQLVKYLTAAAPSSDEKKRDSKDSDHHGPQRYYLYLTRMWSSQLQIWKVQ